MGASRFLVSASGSPTNGLKARSHADAAYHKDHPRNEEIQQWEDVTKPGLIAAAEKLHTLAEIKEMETGLEAKLKEAKAQEGTFDKILSEYASRLANGGDAWKYERRILDALQAVKSKFNPSAVRDALARKKDVIYPVIGTEKPTDLTEMEIYFEDFNQICAKDGYSVVTERVKVTVDGKETEKDVPKETEAEPNAETGRVGHKVQFVDQRFMRYGTACQSPGEAEGVSVEYFKDPDGKTYVVDEVTLGVKFFHEAFPRLSLFKNKNLAIANVVNAYFRLEDTVREEVYQHNYALCCCAYRREQLLRTSPGEGKPATIRNLKNFDKTTMIPPKE